MDELNAAVQKRYPSLHYLSVARAGPWKLFTNQKLETFDDLKGLKIRAPEIEGVIAGLEQVGAEADRHSVQRTLRCAAARCRRWHGYAR